MMQSPRVRSAEPVAARRHDEGHRASRRGISTPDEIAPSQGFRLLCALIRMELRAHPDLNWREGYVDLVEHMKTAAARAQLPYGQDKLTRALHAIERSEQARAPKRQAPPPAPASRAVPRWAAINIFRCCAAEQERFVCTLPPGHEGDHIATDRDEDSRDVKGQVRARWSTPTTPSALRAAKEGR